MRRVLGRRERDIPRFVTWSLVGAVWVCAVFLALVVLLRDAFIWWHVKMISP